ncbi:MAG: SDR family NAD(P)-dependent oxidoreductase [Candidatus Methylomirabilis sp.]|nr:SDR family NAD(P)-dependent oxidoreductase [Candidatus Methylomirabilis sp.]
MELYGRVALVTGAARRVGRAIALALAGRGADVVIHYKSSADEANEVVQAVERLGRRASTIQADLAESDQVEMLADCAVKAFGKIDVLVNSAAIFRRTPLDRLTVGEWEQFLRVNVTGPFFPDQTTGPADAAAGIGKDYQHCRCGGDPAVGRLPPLFDFEGDGDRHDPGTREGAGAGGPGERRRARYGVAGRGV